MYLFIQLQNFRCAEQIRNDIDYHKFPVTIVSVGAEQLWKLRLFASYKDYD